MNPADIACAALLEVGRPDLADLVHVFEDDDGSFYIEPIEPVSAPADIGLVDKAEALMNRAMSRT